MANQSNLAGHVQVGDYAVLGGNVLVHQFCKIGQHTMLGISSVIVKDVPAFLTCMGTPTVPKGMNFEGLKRRGFAKDDLALNSAYRIVYREGLTLNEAIEELTYDSHSNRYVDEFVDSLKKFDPWHYSLMLAPSSLPIKKIAIVAGEASGDQLAAPLIAADNVIRKPVLSV